MFDYWRQTDIVDIERLKTIHINVIGVGGIGSPTTICLTKMGIKNVSVWDDDKVEPHNLPNQFYREEDLGKHKVEALNEICKSFSGTELTVTKERVTEKSPPFSGIVISGVDSMAARKVIWQILRWCTTVPLYIDARMAAETMKIISIRPTDMDDISWFEKNELYDDEAAVQDTCTAQAIIYNTFSIASLITNQIKKFVMNEQIQREVIMDLKTLMMP